MKNNLLSVKIVIKMFSFCRFCAQRKEHRELVTDLQTISQMYTRICPQYDNKESSKQLPQRICGPCSNQLLNCCNFIDQIESAEMKLTEMIMNKSEKALPLEEVIVCENSILIFEPKIELLIPSDMEKRTNDADMLNESDTDQSDREVELMDESDAEQKAESMDESDMDESDTEQSNQRNHNNQEEDIDAEIKRQAYNLNRKRRRMKYVPFFSEVPRGEILADGSVSDETVSKLEQRFPEMKTISWETCKYKCDKCPQVIQGPNQFFIHFQSKHFEELDSYRFPCYNCDDVHESLFKLNRHIATQHYIHLRYRCSTCPKKYFWNLVELDRHQKSHPKKKFDCSLCKKTGLFKTSLAQHIRFSHLLKENPDKFEKFICDICNITCISKGRIKSHMIKHSMTKDFICQWCAHRCSTKGQLKSHIEALHTVSKELFTCPIENCGKQFSSKRRVSSHVKTHAPKSFKCDRCDVVVATKTSLQYHQLIHDDKRPHKCGMCEKTFRLAQSLKVHERIHTGVNPYGCPKCPYSSANWGNLEKHTKRIHSISMKKDHSKRYNIQRQSGAASGDCSN